MGVVFFDDFTGSSLNSSVWTVSSPLVRNGSAEAEYYQSSQVSVANSLLSLTATCLAPGNYIVQNGVTYSWLSGEVQANGSGAQAAGAQPTFGTIMWRAKVPNLAGMWPALWMTPFGAPNGTTLANLKTLQGTSLSVCQNGS